jgi:D-lactate dehydrogenase
MDILSSLAAVFPLNRLKTSLVERIAFGGDAGFYQMIPVAVVQPENEKEIASLFRLSQEYSVPLVFRAAGTSLSGQSITNGILVDIGKHWQKAEVMDDGKTVCVQPGIIGSRVNLKLLEFGRKIGPDPASINAAMMGGILSNNASGMCCGVTYNSYHTLKTIRFMLPNGNVYDTAKPGDYGKFEQKETDLFEGLQQWRETISKDIDVYENIRAKYRMKNTVGYSLNAFVDFEHPLDILAHLMIGAEGTLGFISSATLQTLPDLPYKAAAMLYFPGIYEACSAIEALKHSGAEALELMDRSALRSVDQLPDLPEFFRDLPAGAAALLCEYQAEDKGKLDALLVQAASLCSNLPLLFKAEFTENEKIRQFFWKIRKGMFPSVGAVRQRGSTVILEDIAFPLPVLADAVLDLQKLFLEFGYQNAIIFGHAKEGNIHFVVTQLLNTTAEVSRYDAFMRRVVKLVLETYGGTLKAEHGTGRNMAPFVEAEWGGVAYSIMQNLKATVDPMNLLNPGVIINADNEAHIKDLKQMPEVESEVDKCIECGFCEHHCPSKDVTLTPRQRIQVRRHLKQMQTAGDSDNYKKLLFEYQYAGLDTCATDGLCQVDCPVSINTGDLVKRLRHEQHGSVSNSIANMVSRHFGKAEWLVRFAIAAGKGMNWVFGNSFMEKLTGTIRTVMPVMPRWWREIDRPPARISQEPASPHAVYLSACIQRMMGSNGKEGSVQQAMLDVSRKAGVELLLPSAITGHCCGQAFSSKGYFEAAAIRQRALIDALWQWTKQGQLPVVCDFTSCTYTLLKAGHLLEEPYRSRFEKLTIMDSIQYLHEWVLPGLPSLHKKQKVVLHPGCAAIKMQLIGAMKSVAGQFAEEVIIPTDAGCCGMAGDRGFLFPELTESATLLELAEAKEVNADGYYGSARTCEMALSHFSGKPYQHIVFLVKEVMKKS